ncbi:hypothetical protein D3C85_1353510 [compost metagenome]
MAIQAPGQLTHQQLVDVSRKAARPTPIGSCGQTAIRLALQQGFALQVIGHGNRPQQYGHTRTLLGLLRLATVELVQCNRFVHAAACQA